MRNTRKILVALLVLMTLMVSMFAITSSAADSTRVYVKNDANWSKINCYYWGGSNGPTWPGNAMTYDAELDMYYYDIPSGHTQCIFNNGSSQTADLAVPTGDAVVFNNKTNTWSTMEGDVVVPTFTIAGTGAHLGTEWDVANTANDMTYDKETGIYTKVYEKVSAGTYKFKCAMNHAWTVAYPSSDKSYTVSESGSTVTITLNSSNNAVAVKVDAPVQEPDHVHSWSDATCTAPQKCECGQEQGAALGHSFDADGKCTVCEFVPSYIVAGDVMQVNEVYQQGTNFFGSNWSATDENNKLVYNAETGLFEKTYTGVKIGEYHYQVTSSGSWFGVDNCYINVTSDNSTVTITFNPKGNVMDATVAAHVHNYEAVVTAPTCTVAGYTTYTCACGDSYTADEVAATGHTCVLDICMVCYLPQPSIVLGDNTVVVPPESGSAFGMIYIAEAGTYQITANPATTACIFSTNIYSEGADFSIAADGALGASWYVFSTEPVELQPGYYYIGVYLAGEYTVNLSTYVAPEEPPVVTDPTKLFFNAEVIASGSNGFYSFTTSKKADVSAKIDGVVYDEGLKFNSSGYLTFTPEHDGTVTMYFAHANGSGSNTIYIITLDAEGNEVTKEYVTIETQVSDENNEYSSITFNVVGGANYKITRKSTESTLFAVIYEAAEAPVEPPHENTLVVGDTNKIVVDGSVLNAYGQPIAWVEFVADEKAHYEFVGTDGALAFIYAGDIDINNAPATSLCGYSGKADLEAGTYLICIGGGKTGEFNIAVSNNQ